MPSTDFGIQFDQKLVKLRQGFATRKSFSYDWRIGQLKALRRLLTENDEQISKAMWKDFRKSSFECSVTEQGVVISEIDFAIKHLHTWMKVQRVPTPLINFPGKSRIYHDPYGVVLIIGAWNYPINLLLAPYVGAICGGNATVLKPSEMSSATAQVVADLIPKYMDNDFVAVQQAGGEETSQMLDRQFDLIFFTGSINVGKIVMQKAAVHLTPVTLELGGKSPCIVLKDADLKLAAKRIAWGKFMNAGQTCIAPDYILIEDSIEAEFLTELRSAVQAMYGQDAKQSPDYCRIINDKNFDRLVPYLRDGQVYMGGETKPDERYIAPTILQNVSPTAGVMTDEIFGPILPVLKIKNLDEAIRMINSRPKPLSLYLFSSSTKCQEKILTHTSSGGSCINEVVMHMPIPDMPFGGVGLSGMGHYHGKFSFETFTHAKGVLHKGTWFDAPFRYAPYNLNKLKWVKRFL